MIGDVILSKKNVKVICGFFRSPQNCRGYDLESPIGKIADCAFRHHNLKDRAIFELEKKLEVANSLLECERQKSARLNRELEDVKSTAYAKVRKLKRALYKACANWAHFVVAFYGSYTPEDPWYKMEQKCRAMADKYKE